MVPLYYSVLVFLIPASLGYDTWLGSALHVLIPIAVLNHAKNHEEYSGKTLVRNIDRILSHIYAVIMALDILQHAVCIYTIQFFCCLLYTIYAFHCLKHVQQDERVSQFVHASMHAVSSYGICCYIAVKSKCA